MTLYVTEHANINLHNKTGVVSKVLAAYSLSSLVVTPAMQAGAQYVRLTADAGMFVNNLFASTTGAATSTNSVRLAANAPAEVFAVSTAFRLTAAST